MSVISMKQLLEAGVHFGHQTRRWNPKMKEYIFTERNGIYIIDLQKTVKKAEEAYNFVRSVAEAGDSILFVGTKKQAQESIEQEAKRCEMFYVNQRWLGGMLTNFKTIQTRIAKLRKIEKMEADGDFAYLPKKEVIKLKAEQEKLEKNLSGIKDMKKLPGAMFVVDPRKEHIAVSEARALGIPLPYEQAWTALQKARPLSCDVGQANGEYFFNLAGVGIEAQIAKDFAEYGKNGKRGRWPYFKLGAKEVFSYRPKTLRVQYNGKDEILTPLTLVFANGTQYGSNFKIAPQAEITDGKLDMVEVQNVSKWKLALAAPTFFSDTFRPIEVTRTHKTTGAVISCEGEIVYHLDGEPKVTQNRLEISLLPHALQLLVPHGY